MKKTKNSLIFLDTETTGNDVEKDRLCQVSYKNNGEILTEYFSPPIPITIKSMSITHITNKMVEDKEVFQGSQMYGNLEDQLEEGVLVAHNAKFDIAMLESEGLSVPNSICTLRLVRHLDKDAEIPEYNLQFLRYFHEIEIDCLAHDAEGDVKVLEALFDLLYKKMAKELDTDDEEKIIAEMIEVSGRPSLIRKMPFGKHVGSTLEDLAESDAGYLRWLLTQKERDGDEDWIYSLQFFLDKSQSFR